MTSSLLIPSFAEERILEAQGYRHIAGIDEVGRGALAGPVAAAAVILPLRIKAGWLKLVRDSKQLSPEKREVLSLHIHRVAVSIGIGMVSSEVIDKRGIVGATHLAMRLAIKQLSPPAETLLIDYLHLPGVKLPQKGVTDGDSLCISIACASIVAKVARDRLMVEMDKTYYGYGLAQHKGYGTEEHLACLQRLGPCPIHRQSFSPVKDMIER
ncbi:MAG: ribonuclease HII [Dehalococcoidales bacterium]|nr:ribonuclease HII [Dehalococcoidales bacterium]